MYEKHFSLNENPFRITPDPRFLWYSEPHLEAKSKVVYQITQSAGPILLISDIGTGKTTIARRIWEELNSNDTKKVSYVFAPKLPSANAFLRFIMDEFGVKTDRSYAKSLKNFEGYLIEQKKTGKSPTLLIDEAQNLDREMLLLIQHLFNFSTNTEFLIDVALFSQMEIADKLKRLPSLKSRMAVAKLRALDLNETRELLAFRWNTAGGKDFPFTDEAVTEIFKLTGGIPRYIVKLANESLVRCFGYNKQMVDKDIITEAWYEINISVNE